MSEKIMTALKSFFEQDDWRYKKLPDRSVLQLGFAGKHGTWTCYADAKEEDERFVFYSVFPSKVPEDKRPMFAEYLTRANYGLVLGNFEMDYEDGEIRYKTSIDVESCELPFAMVKQLVYANIAMMDKYMPGIFGLLAGIISAKEAIEKIEQEPVSVPTPTWPTQLKKSTIPS